MPRVLTACMCCGTGCNLYLKVSNGRVVGFCPPRHDPVEEIGLSNRIKAKMEVGNG